MSKTDSTYDRIEQNLFKDKVDASLILTPREMEIRERMMLCVSKRMSDPLVEDSDLVNFLMHGCGGQATPVSQSQAYRDIGMINRLVGNVQMAAKQWYRYMIVEGAKKAYSVAIDKGDAKGAAAALDKIGKYTRCDKEDDRFNYDKMIPPSFEPSDDITLLEGIEPIENLEERRKELRRLAKNLIMDKPTDVEELKE
ncbi:hypothetical protein [Bacteroides heparinolyticus]|uniref:hypothetical protein n=1 Tax=Prevotella heparinolytica TaxID=28113 RepID=UPI00359F5EB7